MLMVTPAAMLRLRSETRSAVSLAPVKLAPARRLKAARREAIIEKLAGMMRRAEPTPFAVEGPARAGIRSALVMQSWPWGQADAAADEVVQAALARIGAERPSWKAGQPEWTQEAVLAVEREFCARCGKRLPEGAHGQTKYCGSVCAKAAAVDQWSRSNREYVNARDKASRAAWLSRQPTRECPSCGKNFQQKWRGNKYCSRQCGLDVQRFARRSVRLVCEAIRDDAK